MRQLLCLLAVALLAACNKSQGPEDIAAAPSAETPPAPSPAAPPQSGSNEVATPQSVAAVPKVSPSTRPSSWRPSAPVPAWLLREQRIHAKTLEWQRLSPEEQSKRLQQALRDVMDRHKCNTVMGCPAREDLVAAGEQAALALVEFYPTVQRDSYNRFHLIEILGEIPSKATIPFLTSLLQSDLWNARANAAFALGRLQAVQARPELERLFRQVKEGNDAAFAYSLAYALQRVGSDEGKSFLLEALRGPRLASVNWGYTRFAVEAVGLLGYTQACIDLVGPLGHKDLFLRRQALEAVARLNCDQTKVLDAAAQLLEDKSPGVRSLAAETLLLVTGMPIKTIKSWNNYKSRRGGN